MFGKRDRHPAASKAKVAPEATKPTRIVAELTKDSRVHPVQIRQWRGS
jgi:hypothetical protein